MRQFWWAGIIGWVLVGCGGEVAVPPTAVVMAEVEIATAAKVSAEGSPPPAATPIPTEAIPEAATEAPIATPTPEPTAESLIAALPGTELFTFSAGEPGWYTVDDDVMGGVSSSSVTLMEPDVLFFSGTMSLDNNGGFASTRSDWVPTDLSAADGVLLRVMGDGKTYRLRIRTAETGPNVSYNTSFETTPETWKLVYVPFSGMVPTNRGFVMNVGELEPASISSFGFMLSDKQPGEFGLFVDWIRVVTEAEMRELAEM